MPAKSTQFNEAQYESELEAIRRSVSRRRPYGGDAWQGKVARQLRLECTFRPRPSQKAAADAP